MAALITTTFLPTQKRAPASRTAQKRATAVGPPPRAVIPRTAATGALREIQRQVEEDPITNAVLSDDQTSQSMERDDDDENLPPGFENYDPTSCNQMLQAFG